jgi:hypothetical protein
MPGQTHQRPLGVVRPGPSLPLASALAASAPAAAASSSAAGAASCCCWPHRPPAPQLPPTSAPQPPLLPPVPPAAPLVPPQVQRRRSPRRRPSTAGPFNKPDRRSELASPSSAERAGRWWTGQAAAMTSIPGSRCGGGGPSAGGTGFIGRLYICKTEDGYTCRTCREAEAAKPPGRRMALLALRTDLCWHIGSFRPRQWASGSVHTLQRRERIFARVVCWA